MVYDNPFLKTARGLHDIWFSTKPNDPYPITLTSFWIQWHLWGHNPLGYHVLNVVLHGVCAVLFWRVLGNLALPGAWLAAAVFAVHPVCAGSVAWITEQKNTNSLLFYLLALLCFLKFMRARESADAIRSCIAPRSLIRSTSINLRRLWYGASLLLFALALMSKGSVVTFPCILLLLLWWRHAGMRATTVAEWKSAILLTAPFFLLSFISGLLTIWYQ